MHQQVSADAQRQVGRPERRAANTTDARAVRAPTARTAIDGYVAGGRDDVARRIQRRRSVDAGARTKLDPARVDRLRLRHVPRGRLDEDVVASAALASLQNDLRIAGDGLGGVGQDSGAVIGAARSAGDADLARDLERLRTAELRADERGVIGAPRAAFHDHASGVDGLRSADRVGAVRAVEHARRAGRRGCQLQSAIDIEKLPAAKRRIDERAVVRSARAALEDDLGGGYLLLIEAVLEYAGSAILPRPAALDAEGPAGADHLASRGREADVRDERGLAVGTRPLDGDRARFAVAARGNSLVRACQHGEACRALAANLQRIRSGAGNGNRLIAKTRLDPGRSAFTDDAYMVAVSDADRLLAVEGADERSAARRDRANIDAAAVHRDGLLTAGGADRSAQDRQISMHGEVLLAREGAEDGRATGAGFDRDARRAGRSDYLIAGVVAHHGQFAGLRPYGQRIRGDGLAVAAGDLAAALHQDTAGDVHVDRVAGNQAVQHHRIGDEALHLQAAAGDRHVAGLRFPGGDDAAIRPAAVEHDLAVLQGEAGGADHAGGVDHGIEQRVHALRLEEHRAAVGLQRPPVDHRSAVSGFVDDHADQAVANAERNAISGRQRHLAGVRDDHSVVLHLRADQRGVAAGRDDRAGVRDAAGIAGVVELVRAVEEVLVGDGER